MLLTNMHLQSKTFGQHSELGSLFATPRNTNSRTKDKRGSAPTCTSLESKRQRNRLSRKRLHQCCTTSPEACKFDLRILYTSSYSNELLHTKLLLASNLCCASVFRKLWPESPNRMNHLTQFLDRSSEEVSDSLTTFSRQQIKNRILGHKWERPPNRSRTFRSRLNHGHQTVT